jgi:hypothetical protein
MIGGVISVLICIWFYRTADRLKLNPLQWIVGALVVYYGIKAVWTYAILKPILGTTFKYHTFTSGVMIEISGALQGAVGAALFHYKVLRKQAR